MMMRAVWSIVVGLGVIVATPAAEPMRKAVVADKGMVVCVSPPATDVGAAILAQGGSAVDAAVAVALAMAVTYPPAGNIGGGGFMLVYPGANQPATCFEYRETAPAAATADMFAKDANWLSHRAVGVPGTVRGLELAHQRYGKLPWKTVAMPAVELAEKGFTLSASMARSLNSVLKESDTPAEFRRVFGKPGGGDWQAGDRLVQPELGKTMRRIAEQGPDSFYTGESAELLVAEMKAGGGLITKADLAAYQAKARPALRGTYRGYEVIGAPLPSSGGTAIIQMLNMLENFDVKKHPRFSAETLHLLTEVQRRAFADRARYLGDADFVKIPAFLTTKEYAKKRAGEIDLTKATRSIDLAGDIPIAPESDSTTHFSIIDANGLAVSNTYTLERSYGTKIVVKGAGYLLNNEMLDFNHRPGYTDQRGAIGTPPNQVAPGKRMLSSQTPTIIVKDGKPYLITGSPGGRTIINTVLNVLVNVLDYDMEIQAAIDAPRTHMQWFPDELRFEGIDQYPEAVKRLREMGHKVSRTKQGDAHSIWIDPKTGKYHGAADPRIDGKAQGN